ncbi:hypothetical protein Cni_G18246 [Canna indica]|uniref:Uncharacterized protein n=1 Tax=Canna indica TaxID=4628 RepID=A0AAQ3QHH9_9LILI|nr:hypothetical protein Cni_G18246 [Canna indica]
MTHLPIRRKSYPHLFCAGVSWLALSVSFASLPSPSLLQVALQLAAECPHSPLPSSPWLSPTFTATAQTSHRQSSSFQRRNVVDHFLDSARVHGSVHIPDSEA